jgi:hypothetical protein
MSEPEKPKEGYKTKRNRVEEDYDPGYDKG